MNELQGLYKDIPKIKEKDVKIALWLCFLAWTFAMYDFILFGNLLPEFAKDLGWNSSMSAGVNTAVMAGTALVAFSIGPIVDGFGRKKGIVIAVGGAAVASALTTVAGIVAGITGGIGLVLIVLVRSFAGLGYAEQAVNATYLNELFAQRTSDPFKVKRRGFVYSLVQAGYPVGSILAASSIYVLFPIGGWELSFIVALFPAIFILIAARYLKETPQFVVRKKCNELLQQRKCDSARVLAAQYGVDIEEQATPLVAAFKGESKRSTLVIGTAFCLNWFGALTFSVLGTSVLSAEDGKDIAFQSALVILIISNVTAFVGYLFHGWLGDRIGRRNTIAIGWILCALIFAAMLKTPPGSYGITVALYSAGLFFLIGPYSALLFFGAESFPVHTRATGGSFINAMGQVGSFIASLGITASLASGATWLEASALWGCLPIFLSGLIILGARNVAPSIVRAD